MARVMSATFVRLRQNSVATHRLALWSSCETARCGGAPGEALMARGSRSSSGSSGSSSGVERRRACAIRSASAEQRNQETWPLRVEQVQGWRGVVKRIVRCRTAGDGGFVGDGVAGDQQSSSGSGSSRSSNNNSSSSKPQRAQELGSAAVQARFLALGKRLDERRRSRHGPLRTRESLGRR